MLARRGLRPSLARPDLPFLADISSDTADALAERLGRYAFRLFVRGVIQHGDGFTPPKRQAISMQPRPSRRSSREESACEVNSAIRTL